MNFFEKLFDFSNPSMWIWVALALILGAVIGWLVVNSVRNNRDIRLKRTADDIIAAANEEAIQVKLEAKDEALKFTRQAEVELQQRRSELNKEDDRLVKRREELDRRFDQMQQRESSLNKRQSSIDKRANEIDSLYAERLNELQRVAELSTEEARDILLEEVERTARNDMARIVRQIENEARETGEEKARELIAHG